MVRALAPTLFVLFPCKHNADAQHGCFRHGAALKLVEDPAEQFAQAFEFALRVAMAAFLVGECFG